MRLAARAPSSAIAATLLVGASPAVTVAVITESRARGPLTDLATEVVVLMEVASSCCSRGRSEAARIAFGTAPDLSVLIADAAWSVLGSIAFGALIGALFTLYLRYVGREVTVVLVALCALLTGAGAQLDLDPLLAGLAAGIVVQNAMPTGGRRAARGDRARRDAGARAVLRGGRRVDARRGARDGRRGRAGGHRGCASLLVRFGARVAARIAGDSSKAAALSVAIAPAHGRRDARPRPGSWRTSIRPGAAASRR